MKKAKECQERFHVLENVPVSTENKTTVEEMEILPKAFEDYLKRRKRLMKLQRLAMLRP